MAHQVDWQELSREVSTDRRGGKRVAISYPVTVSGVSAGGDAFSEKTRTTNISENGCCFESELPLELGKMVTITVNHRPGEGQHRFQVVRVVPNGKAWVVGAKLVKSPNIWGVAFPPTHNLRKPTE